MAYIVKKNHARSGLESQTLWCKEDGVASMSKAKEPGNCYDSIIKKFL